MNDATRWSGNPNKAQIASTLHIPKNQDKELNKQSPTLQPDISSKQLTGSKAAVSINEENVTSAIFSTVRTTAEAGKFFQTIIASLTDIPEEEYLRSNASFFTLRPTRVSAFTPTLLLDGRGLCSPDGPFLLVVVPSIDDHVRERETIRTTWASVAYGGKWPNATLRHSIKLAFFLGVRPNTNSSALNSESNLYGDIVQADFEDTYKNLSLKIAAVLQWSNSYCAHAGHVLKVDEDTFVNLPLLLDLLDWLRVRRARYILGYRHLYSKPLVVRSGRWKVDVSVYPLPLFPQYLYGHSYVISGDAVTELFLGHLRMPVVPNEDAYVTGILAKTLNITRIHCPYFAHLNTVPIRCELVHNRAVSQTYRETSELYHTWELYKSSECYQNN